MTVESTATSGHILVIDKVSAQEYVAVVKSYLTYLCEAGLAEEAVQLLTGGISRLDDKELYEAVREPFVEQNSEEKRAVRAAVAIAKSVEVIVFPCKMLQYDTQYGRRPRLLIAELRKEQQRQGLRLAVVFTVRADGSICREH